MFCGTHYDRYGQGNAVMKCVFLTSGSTRAKSLSWSMSADFCADSSSRFYRAMHYSAKRGLAIAYRESVCPSVCPSVCNVGGSGPDRLKILETNCANN